MAKEKISETVEAAVLADADAKAATLAEAASIVAALIS